MWTARHEINRQLQTLKLWGPHHLYYPGNTVVSFPGGPIHLNLSESLSFVLWLAVSACRMQWAARRCSWLSCGDYSAAGGVYVSATGFKFKGYWWNLEDKYTESVTPWLFDLYIYTVYMLYNIIRVYIYIHGYIIYNLYTAYSIYIYIIYT